MSAPPIIVGLGEILWDILPSGRQLGGAPANFAYCAHLLGNRAMIASRIGTDELGGDVRNRLRHTGLGDSFLQSDSAHPTGTVTVELDPNGQPKYDITAEVAWDFTEWTDAWKSLAQSADAVCFGSLAQRSPVSRATILKLLKATRKDALRVFDVNLRQKFYSAEILEQSLRAANVLKINAEELAVLKHLLGVRTDFLNEASICKIFLGKFDLQLVCVTHGANGSLLCDSSRIYKHSGFQVEVKDTVGSGDGFTAGLVHGLLSGQTPDEMNDLANRMGAWVASNSGAMPAVPALGLEQTLARLATRKSF
jgi:fructokinase